MVRWAPTLSLLVALAPPLVLAHTVAARSAPATVTKVTVTKAKVRKAKVRKPPSPYQPHASASRRHRTTALKRMAPRFYRVLPAPTTRAGAAERAINPLGLARACKVYDPNVGGAAKTEERPVADWRFRLTNSQQVSWVRTTGDDGCVTFPGLLAGTYALTELVPPEWPAAMRGPVRIEVRDPTGRKGVPLAKPTTIISSCVKFARMGSTEYWRGLAGVQLMEERDRLFVNSLDPFRSPSPSFAKGDEPFDGRFSDDVTLVRGTSDGSSVSIPGTWQAELSNFLGDGAVSADPPGRLAQEILALALNGHHFLEHALVIYVEDMPIFVDDLYFEGVIAWHSGNRRWIRDMTAFLAAINGSANLQFVPHDHCQVAYLPF